MYIIMQMICKGEDIPVYSDRNIYICVLIAVNELQSSEAQTAEFKSRKQLVSFLLPKTILICLSTDLCESSVHIQLRTVGPDYEQL